jgi:hypothetical protein
LFGVDSVAGRPHGARMHALLSGIARSGFHNRGQVSKITRNDIPVLFRLEV